VRKWGVKVKMRLEKSASGMQIPLALLPLKQTLKAGKWFSHLHFFLPFPQNKHVLQEKSVRLPLLFANCKFSPISNASKLQVLATSLLVYNPSTWLIDTYICPIIHFEVNVSS